MRRERYLQDELTIRVDAAPLHQALALFVELDDGSDAYGFMGELTSLMENQELFFATVDGDLVTVQPTQAFNALIEEMNDGQR